MKNLALRLPGLLLLALPLPLAAQAPKATGQEGPAPIVRKLGPGIVMEIDPRIELLSAVLLNCPGGGRGSGAPADMTDYARELKTLFPQGKDSRAMAAWKEATGKGFSYDAPPSLALESEGGLSFARPAGGYPKELAERARGGRNLERLAAGLGDCAKGGGFGAFWESHRNYYESLLDGKSRGLEADRIAAWLGDYYGGPEASVFHYVLAPGLFPGGGYGITVERTEGGKKVRHVYQVIRDPERTEPDSLGSLALHEFGHSFVNPAIGGALSGALPAATRRSLESLYEPVKGDMRDMAYGQLPIFLNELVLRATTIRGERLLGLIDDEGVDSRLEAEAMRGFYPIRAVYSSLAGYEADRSAYPSFASFGPVLLSRLAKEAPGLLAGRPEAKPRLASFATGFEGLAAYAGPANAADPHGAAGTHGMPMVPGPAFAVEVGSENGGRGGVSAIGLDTAAPFEGKASLRLSGGADTTIWRYLAIPVEVRKGRLELGWAARGKDIRVEGEQYDSTYVGLVVHLKSGKSEYRVRSYAGSFDWKRDGIAIDVNPAEVSSLEAAIFLSESGELSVDAFDLRYK
jgi:hypothetical protein